MTGLRIRFQLIALLSAILMVSGCARYVDLPAGTVKQVGSPIVQKQEVTVSEVPLGPPPPAEYVIGPNDVLNIDSNLQAGSGSVPAGLMAANTGLMGSVPNASARSLGSRVDGNGNIQLPKIGVVHVAGLTPVQVQKRIRERLRKYLKDPWVVVEVADFRSKPLYLLGQFREPGTHFMDRPMNLLQGIALGRGFDSGAYLRGARLNRDGRIMPVDVYELLLNGNNAHNVWLRAGDTIFIPDNRNQQVFVFGAVKKPGPVPMMQGGLNLAQAIGSAELRDTGYDFKHVRIIRSLSATRGELLVVDFDKILRGEALPLPLMEGDIVYVPRSHFGAWNDAINEMLPTLQAIGTLLQPFVQVKFLTDSSD
jgi:polysaccharide export outer membrane protein